MLDSDFGHCNHKLSLPDNDFNIIDYEEEIQGFNKDIIVGSTNKNNIKNKIDIIRKKLNLKEEYKIKDIKLDKLNGVLLAILEIKSNDKYEEEFILIEAKFGKVLTVNNKKI